MINIKEQALREFEEEFFRKKVDKYKDKLREKRYWFPWRIQIINLNRESEL